MGMKLFCAWVKEGDAVLKGPRDWHEVGAYLGGYAVAWRFGGEGCGNRGKFLPFLFFIFFYPSSGILFLILILPFVWDDGRRAACTLLRVIGQD